MNEVNSTITPPVTSYELGYIDGTMGHTIQGTMQDEVRFREIAIEQTIKIYGNQEVNFEDFAILLEAVYSFLRYGVPFETKQTTK